MSEATETKVKLAVAEWQKKYGIKDGDPLLATLELFQIYFLSWQERRESGRGVVGYEEFRGSLEILEHRTKQLSNIASDLIDALRAAPQPPKSGHGNQSLALVIASFFALITGFCAGKYFF